MGQARINKKRQAAANRLRRQRKQVLRLELRDPDVVRAKDLRPKMPP